MPVIREEVAADGTKRVVTRYDSLRDLADCGEDTVGSSKKTDNPFWSGTPSWKAARKLAESGWTTGGATLDTTLDRIRPAVGDAIAVQSRMAFVHTPNVPGALNIGRYAAGDPRCLISPVFTSKVPIVKIAVPAIWQATLTADSILQYGAVAAAVCEVLMAAGYGVEVNAVAGWDRRDGSFDVSEVVLKHSTEQLDVEDIAFGIAHPSMSRRFIFASGESRPHSREIHCYKGGGYGGYHQWSGTNPQITGGMGDIDLTPMSSISNASNSNVLQRGIDIALAAIAVWKSR
jgi:hypothetical protein